MIYFFVILLNKKRIQADYFEKKKHLNFTGVNFAHLVILVSFKPEFLYQFVRNI